jgi:hypothetical protein
MVDVLKDALTIEEALELISPVLVEQRRKRHRDYYLRNRDKILMKVSKYNQKSQAKVRKKEYAKQYASTHVEKLREQKRNYYQRNLDREKKRMREYSRRPEVKEQRKTYAKIYNAKRKKLAEKKELLT